MSSCGNVSTWSENCLVKVGDGVCGLAQGQTEQTKRTHSTGEGSPVLLMNERDDASRVLNNDGERKRREIIIIIRWETITTLTFDKRVEDVTWGVPR